ncbi:MAG: hypothetical protein WBA43_00475 [Elainellaceae cyanobacterium]
MYSNLDYSRRDRSSRCRRSPLTSLNASGRYVSLACYHTGTVTTPARATPDTVRLIHTTVEMMNQFHPGAGRSLNPSFLDWFDLVI